MIVDSEDAQNEFIDRWMQQTLTLGGYQHVPRNLFKFISTDSKYFQANLRELLLHNRIRLSSRSELNDPFDALPGVAAMTSAQAEGHLLSAAYEGAYVHPGYMHLAKRNPNKFRRLSQANLRDAVSETGIYSMTAIAFHPLMWAHYANSNRGIALVFRHGSSHHHAEIFAMPVRYADTVPRASLDNFLTVPLAMLVKGTAWSYEREWRISLPHMARKWIDIPPASVWGIVFGACCSVEDREYVMGLVEMRRAAGLGALNLLTAVIDDENFQLDFFSMHSSDRLPWWSSAPQGFPGAWVPKGRVSRL